MFSIAQNYQNLINGVLSNFYVTIPDANTGVTITATSSGKTGTNNSFDMGSASSPAIILLQPNGLETLVAGSAYSIQLSSPNLSDGALGILFSSDRGSSWSTVATDLPLSQTFVYMGCTNWY